MNKLIVILIFACCFSIAKAQEYQIKAELTGFEDGTKFYLQDIMAGGNIDSAILQDGKLTMNGTAGKVRPLWFCCTYKDEFYFTNLLTGAEQVTIKADLSEFPWFTSISGSKTQDVANILNLEIRQLWKDRDSVVKVLFPIMNVKQNDSLRNVSKLMIKKLNLLDSTREAITNEFIVKYLNSDAALLQLYYKKGDYEKTELNHLIANLNQESRNSPFGILLLKYQKLGDILEKGDQFYDFSAKTLAGKSYQVSGFKGKYILLDFVETYCGPCIESAVDLRNLAIRNPNELQILSFYVEKDAKIVRKGLERDRPTWPAIWDGKGSESAIVQKYGVTGYPTFVLISPDGKIIMHSSGFAKGEDGKGSLATAVEKLLPKTK